MEYSLGRPGEARGEVEKLFADLLGSGTSLRLRVEGPSMGPAVRDGDVVVIEPPGPGVPRLGEVLLCRAPGGLVLHRLVSRRRSGGRTLLVTRGDALDREDEPVELSGVLGRAVRVVRPGPGGRIAERDLAGPLARLAGRLSSAARRELRLLRLRLGRAVP